MKGFTLTAEEKMQLECGHAQLKDDKERDRIKAVLLCSEGWKISMISQALRLHETTVARHLTDYEKDKLRPGNGGSKSSLGVDQTQELISHLELQTYHHMHEIIEYVHKKYGIRYSIPGMNKWLHRNRFSYKKPKGHPHKSDTAQQRAFIAYYQRLQKRIDSTIYGFSASKPSDKTELWLDKGRSDKKSEYFSQSNTHQSY